MKTITLGLHKELKSITEKFILTETKEYNTLFDASRALKAFFTKITKINYGADFYRNHHHTNEGLAIGTTWAAMCIDDFMRTWRFLRGIHKAIEQKLAENKSRPIHIIYAGTGPFATLLTPFITQYSSQAIQFTFLEINSQTFDLLKNVVNVLEMEDYIVEMECCDAVSYKIKQPESVDIIVSETMQNGLRNEHQVPLVLNLMKQVSADTILIPAHIEIGLALNKVVKNSSRVDENLYLLKNLLLLNQERVIQDDFLDFKKIKVKLPKDKIKEYHSIVLTTFIDVFKNEKLEAYESGLTLPHKVLDIDLQYKGQDYLETRYVIGRDTGFKMNLVR